MTHPWLSLFKALLNVNFGVSALKHQIKSRERIWEPLLILLGLLVGGGSIIFLVVLMAGQFVQVGLTVGQPELILTMAHLAAAIMVFVFGIAFVMSSMYFANDIPMLMSMPLRPRQIVSAKVATVLVNEYLTMAVILIPVYAVYAVHVPVSPWYYPTAVLTFLLTPIIPLLVATLVTMVLMRAVGGARRRDLLTMVGSLLAIVVYLAIQWALQSTDVTEAEIAEILFERLHGLSQVMAAGFPPGLWGMQSLALAGTGAGLWALVKLAGLSVVLFAALLVLGERVFVRAVQEGGETGKRRRRAALDLREGSAVAAVARVERRLILRTPVYALNGLLGFILFPVLLFLPVYSDMEALNELLSLGVLDPMVGALILGAWFGLATATSAVLPTAFSREGSRFLWILKSQPLSGREFFLGKLKGGLSMMLIGSLPGAVLIIYLLKLGPASIVLGLLLGVLLSTLISVVGLGVDMMRPMLNWTDPARAMKSNLNVLILFVILAAIAIAGFFGGRFLIRLGADLTTLVVTAIAGISVILGLLWLLWAPRFDAWLSRMGD